MGALGSKDHTEETLARRREIVEKANKIQGLTRLITAESRRERDVAKDVYDFRKVDSEGRTVLGRNQQEHMQLLKQLFKKMDPSVMKMNSRHMGDLQLSFKYDDDKKLLMVKVIKAKDLTAKDLRGKFSDAYVKIYLFPDAEEHGMKRTRVVKQSLNPIFHEIFTFSIEKEKLADCQMIAQVWDHDIMDRDDFIGEAIFGFAGMDFNDQAVHTAWYKLQFETDLCITGDIEVTLAFRMPSSLLVKVHRGNNLTDRDGDRKPSPFVKMQIPGIAKVHKTQMKEDTMNPVWDETFEFPIMFEELRERYIIFHVIDFDDGGENSSLGQVIIDLNQLDPDAGLHGSYGLADLKNSERLRSKWFQNATLQEFREGLTAHAAFRCPSFLFKDHKGAKVVTVTSRKAGSSARLQIVDGIPVY